MKWSHLPVDGGLYDQHPLLLDQWRYIFSKRNEYEAEQEAKRKSESARKNKPSSPSRGRTPRRR